MPAFVWLTVWPSVGLQIVRKIFLHELDTLLQESSGFGEVTLHSDKLFPDSLRRWSTLQKTMTNFEVEGESRQRCLQQKRKKNCLKSSFSSYQTLQNCWLKKLTFLKISPERQPERRWVKSTRGLQSRGFPFVKIFFDFSPDFPSFG